MDCIFCKIVLKEIPSKILYEDDKMLVFHDISPQAPSHVLLIPKKHIPTLTDLTPDDTVLMGHMMVKIPEIVKELGLTGKGVRLVSNCGAEAGQAVFHLHFHLMGGRAFTWPPG